MHIDVLVIFVICSHCFLFNSHLSLNVVSFYKKVSIMFENCLCIMQEIYILI